MRGILPVLALLLALTAHSSGSADDGNPQARSVIGDGAPTAFLKREATSPRPGTGAAINLAGTSRAPNILLIVADDLGYNDLAINNSNPAIDTPELDKLARQGLRFTRHYSHPVCSSARAALLTGQYPERNGFLPAGRGIPAERITLAERLQQAGYTTRHIGKWHLGHNERQAWPDRQGFDQWFGFLDQWRLAGRQVDGAVVPAAPRYQRPWLEGSEQPGAFYPGHLENILTEYTLQELETLSAQSQPWFINLWFYAPHAPISPARSFAADYPQTPAGRYRALVRQLDANVGRILAKLERMEAAENTIVVFVSDNGGTNSLLDNNAPFTGRKSTLFEGGIRTPLLLRLPHMEDAGQVVEHTVSIMDIYPTLLALTGIEAPGDLDGQSFAPALEGTALPPRQLFWEHIFNYSVLSANGHWRVHQPGGSVPVQVFDYRSDPFALAGVVPQPPALRKTLLEGHSEWYRGVHRVAATYRASDIGGEVAGFDLLRTPGFGGYTFASAFSEPYQGQLVSQGSLWGMEVMGDSVVARFGELELYAGLTASGTCHSAVISGQFYRQINHWGGGDSLELSLYVDGVKADSLTAATALPADDIAKPTILGDPAMAGMNGPVYPPLILNNRLEFSMSHTAASLHMELCGND